MGWGLYLSFDRDMGLSLWDIRLKGERIIYQVDCSLAYAFGTTLLNIKPSSLLRKHWLSMVSIRPPSRSRAGIQIFSAGNDPMQATTAWLDRYFGMGMAVRDLLPHYDCPSEAVFLPAITHGESKRS